MERYRVLFEGNKPFTALKIGWETKETLKLNCNGDKKSLEWFVVYGDDENDAMHLANNIVNESLIGFLT